MDVDSQSFSVVERFMAQQRETYLTEKGPKKLKAELLDLCNISRQEAADCIQSAKEIGGTVDNAEYDEAKNEQTFVEGRIRTAEHMISSVVVIPNGQASHSVVAVGSRVSVSDESGRKQNYELVGRAEVDPRTEFISNESPIGSALLGRHLNDEVKVKAPRGVITLKILAVE
jgi:transcription elongation factor GreA